MSDTSLNSPPPQLPEQPKIPHRTGRFLLVAVILGLLGGAAYGISAIQRSFLEEITVETVLEPTKAPLASPGEFIERVAPDFTLQDIGGTTVHLREFRGKPIVLLFFASWNEMSLDALRSLEGASKKLSDAGVAALTIDNLETLEEARRLGGRMGLAMQVLADSGGIVGEAYRITTLPSFFFIDADGIVKEHAVGTLSADDILVKAL